MRQHQTTNYTEFRLGISNPSWSNFNDCWQIEDIIRPAGICTMKLLTSLWAYIIHQYTMIRSVVKMNNQSVHQGWAVQYWNMEPSDSGAPAVNTLFYLELKPERRKMIYANKWILCNGRMTRILSNGFYCGYHEEFPFLCSQKFFLYQYLYLHWILFSHPCPLC